MFPTQAKAGLGPLSPAETLRASQWVLMAIAYSSHSTEGFKRAETEMEVVWQLITSASLLRLSILRMGNLSTDVAIFENGSCLSNRHLRCTNDKCSM
jgi:hypothetical protein